MSSIEDMRRSIMVETIAIQRANELRAAIADLQRLAHIISFGTGIESRLVGIEEPQTRAVAALALAGENMGAMLDVILPLIGEWNREVPPA